jgi:pancreatic triacylglycerol lipase
MYQIENITQILTHKRFDVAKPTVMYVFGWTRDPGDTTTLSITDAYLRRGDYNVLVLDWSDYTVGFYSRVLVKMCQISRIYSRVLTRLFDKGLSAKSFHCLGHSFGAHSCGIMGRYVYQISNRRHKFGRFAHCCV